MNHFQQQQQQQAHVAQQSRREKLRIPGSLHPSSPGNDHHSHTHSQQAGDHANYTGVLYSSDAYNIIPGAGAAGSELLAAYGGKANGFSDMLSSHQQHQQPQQQHNLFSNPLAKNWSSSGGSYPGNEAAMQLFQLTGYQYSDPAMLVSPSSGSSVTTAGGASGVVQQQQQHFIGIPLTPDGGSSGIGAGGGGGGGFGRSGNGYQWRNGGDEFLFLPSSEATNRKAALPGDAMSQMELEALRQQSSLTSILGQQQQQQQLLQAGARLQELENSSSSHPVAGGGAYQSLSLSLSNPNAQLQALEQQQSGLSSPASQDGKRVAQQQVKDLSHFRSSPREASLSYPSSAGSKQIYFEAGGGGAGGGAAAAAVVSSSFNFVSGSRYLRAAQQLLDEVCSVGRGGVKQSSSKSRSQGAGATTTIAGAGQSTSPTAVTSSMHGGSKEAPGGENSVKSEVTMGSSGTATAGSPGTGAPATAAATAVAPSTAAENKAIAVLTPEERQEYEGKKTKLLAMLQEVDRRYRQYYDQMQIVITSFDAVAGAGAATPYTALALQAMSRYFRCLRDAITTQIQTTCKALGEEDVTKSITSRPLTSRLRFIDQQIRQQRAYQQYGMLQQHAWRPQRGLPERSVSILRAWLFEHFLHPYPKDADKMMLARQTGLSRGQVSNWFINARVRLWKPMVEEMYQEEIKEQELGVASARLAIDPEDKHHHDTLGEGMMSGDSGRSDHSLAMVDKMQLDHSQHHHPSGSYSDYTGLMMRKQSDPQLQMFGDGSQQTQDSSSQVKKTRLGIHDPMGSAGGLLGADPVSVAVAAGMEVDLKSDSAGICMAPSPSLDSRHYVHEQYVHPDNFAAVAAAVRYTGAGGGFGATYPGPSSGVSLTLGLRNCDNLQQQIQQTFLAQAQQQQQQQQHHHQQQNFLAPRNHHHHHHHHHHQLDPGAAGELCNVYENAGGGLNAGEQEGIDYQGRKPQQIEGHLLHDFVA